MRKTCGTWTHEGGFRPCSRCGRRTFSICEDCGRYTCPECSSVEIVRLGTRNVLYHMCARCRFEYNSQDLLGACAGMWTELWRRIEAEDPPSPTSSGRVNLSR